MRWPTWACDCHFGVPLSKSHCTAARTSSGERLQTLPCRTCFQIPRHVAIAGRHRHELDAQQRHVIMQGRVTAPPVKGMTGTGDSFAERNLTLPAQHFLQALPAKGLVVGVVYVVNSVGVEEQTI